MHLFFFLKKTPVPNHPFSQTPADAAQAYLSNSMRFFIAWQAPSLTHGPGFAPGLVQHMCLSGPSVLRSTMADVPSSQALFLETVAEVFQDVSDCGPSFLSCLAVARELMARSKKIMDSYCDKNQFALILDCVPQSPFEHDDSPTNG